MQVYMIQYRMHYNNNAVYVLYNIMVVKLFIPSFLVTTQFIDIGIISSLEVNHKQVDIAHKGEEVCIKIEPMGGDAPKLYGRHFDHTDLLISKVGKVQSMHR